MAITKEMVLAKAKKIGKEYSEDEIKFFVNQNVLPMTEDEAKDLSDSKIPKSRFDEVNTAKVNLEKEKTELEKSKKLLEDKQKAMESEMEKLKQASPDKDGLKAMEDMKKSIAAQQVIIDTLKTEKANDLIKAKELTKEKAIDAKIANALKKAGCNDKYIEDAKKLFDKSKFVFDFTNEDKLEYEIQEDAAYLEEYKSSHQYWFGEEDTKVVKDENGNPIRIEPEKKTTDWLPKSTPRKGETLEDNKLATLMNNFPALKGTVARQ